MTLIGRISKIFFEFFLSGGMLGFTKAKKCLFLQPFNTHSLSLNANYNPRLIKSWFSDNNFLSSIQTFYHIHILQRHSSNLSG